MKKLSLKQDVFDKGEVLTRAQLKKVMGGDGSGSGSGNSYFCQCADGSSINVSAPTEQSAMEMAGSICQPYVVHCSPSF